MSGLDERPVADIANELRELGDPLADEAATALERVVRERDEAREACQMNGEAWEREKTRAESAEAKLAEARKVIERIRSEASSWAASYSFARLIADAARRWVEETK